MNRFTALALLAVGVGATVVATPSVSHAKSVHTGVIESVWEDGFRLQTATSVLLVDSWDVYGDDTAAVLDAGDVVTVTGELEGGEFDAFTIVSPL